MPEGRSPPIGRFRNRAHLLVWRDTPIAGDPMVQPGYARVGRLWCSLRVRAGEMTVNGVQREEAPGPRGTHMVQTRFREGLTTQHMLEIAGQRYKVVSVHNDDARRFTQLEAELYGEADMIGAPLDTVLWDPIQSEWDGAQSAWDGGATVWDEGSTIWDDGLTIWPR